MKVNRTLVKAIACLAVGGSIAAHAQAIKTWTGGDGNFFDPSHWDTGTIPGTDPTDIAEIRNGSTATISTADGAHTFGAIRLGPTQDSTESGHVIMNGGRLNLGGTSGDPKAVIGFSASPSSFIMNGGTIYFDGPDTGQLNTNFKGVNELDWEVGEKGIGLFEMHNDAVFHGSDDLKVAENAAGNGTVLIDGNAHLSVGSGISISAGGTHEQLMTIAGHAVVDSGNSMGAGDPAGGTDEGYLTMATGGGLSKLIIQENGVLNIRRLTAREGTSTIIVKDHGQFNIFDVLNGKGGSVTPPDRPAETGPNSTYPSTAATATLTLQDDAVMTVNSEPASGPVQGLGISSPRDPGNAGGTGILIVKDRASFRVEQNLYLGTGSNPNTSDGTLEVVGPNTSVSIGGNLNMAVDTDGNIAGTDPDTQLPKAGKATLSEVITSSTHSIVSVTGNARIAQGKLKVKLSGYTPVNGNVFTLIQGGTVQGQFASTDFTEAPLSAGLHWQVDYASDSVKLRVVAQAGRVLTVTTADNVNPPAGQLSLLQVMTGLQEGDTIKFNIPGAGPHFIETPPDGYPLITVNGVTIDGYSQPGAVPNTNPILAANNAQIKIVLDSRNGNYRLLDFEPDAASSGYGDSEAATLGIYVATNVTISGVSILSVPIIPGGSPSGDDISMYAISFAKGASGHIAGCWIGVAPDGITIAGPADAVTGFRYRFVSTDPYTMNDNIIFGVKPASTNAPAEFNVITGVPGIPIIIEGSGTRISGNFFNVYPNGIQDWNPPLVDPTLFSGTFEGNIEIGRANNNTIIGVDGDGVNDANERNVFSGVLPPDQGGYDHNIEFYGQTPGTNIVVAGNYFGLGVDGTTRFTNGVPALNAAGGSAQFRFGSDLDGVSDAFEGNVVYNNWPPDMFPTTGAEGFFDELSAGAILGARGNVFVNNFPFPVSPQKLSGADTFWNAYYAKALVDVSAGVVPTLSSNTTLQKLVGTVPVADTNNYPTTIIDLYAADPEGIAYGQSTGAPELPNGYVQGKTYIGSFVDNSAADKNKTAGQFEFDIGALDVKGSLLTITANYVQAPAGTHNAITLTSPFSEPVEVTFLPGSIESVGLTRITPDAPVNVPAADSLGNWEPYASVIGNSTFLIEGNTFANYPAAPDVWQRYVVMAQPVDGKPGKLEEGFYADNGTPYDSRINGSRENGNPGRVAGDKRPGAVNYIVGGETSVHAVPEFQSAGRWDNGIDRGPNALLDTPDPSITRFATVQTFKLDPATLTPTSLMKAIDSADGRLASGTPLGTENSRFGGELAGLDNGNFASVVEDRTGFWNSAGNGHAVVATIIAPDGSIVKDTWKVADGDIWSNVAAYNGGFAVRASGIIYFYNNAGNLMGQVNQSTSGEVIDSGRGDGVRIAAHINSPYVFMAGRVAAENVVRLLAWDSRDRSFVAKADVSEGAFSGGFDRANLAVDALNRVVVGWVSQPAGYEMQQVAARVMALNESTKTITPLTKSFLPFINAAQGGGIRTLQMSLAMTTKQILIAAKGEINLQNQPQQGANSPREINFYTVFTHPAPAEDPTAPASGGNPRLVVQRNGNSITISWQGTGFKLQTSPKLPATAWTDIATTGNSYTTSAAAGTAFFRLINQ